ncbi:MAG: hypothetical protein PHV45_04990 [Desulfuromonas thiophila]|nr:hypothetical protein [Desulfuromonas thiophila]
MKLSKEAWIGTAIVLALLVAAFIWTLSPRTTPQKYHPPYKYFSGDKPEFVPSKNKTNKFFPAERQ